MPIRRKHRLANNLGGYSRKRICLSPTPTPQHECMQQGTANDTLAYDILDTDNFNIELDSDSSGSQSGDDNFDENIDHTPIPPPKNALFEHLSQSQIALSHLVSKRGAIAGNKVHYAGATINSIPAERTKYLHAAKQRATKKKVNKMIQKTMIDKRKQTIRDHFPPNNMPDSHSHFPNHKPIVVSDSDTESDNNQGEIDSDLDDCHSVLGRDNFEINDVSPTPSASLSLPPESLTATNPQSPYAPCQHALPQTAEQIGMDSLHEVVANEDDPTRTSHCHSHPFVPPPSRKDVDKAAEKISEIVCPRRKGPGHKHTDLDNLTRMRLEQMLQLLHLYSSGQVSSPSEMGWIQASEWIAISWNCGPSYASRLRKWCRDFLADFETIPMNPYGKWKESILVTDEDLRHEIEAHLRSLGPYISAMDVVRFLNTPEMRERLNRENPYLSEQANGG
ncbi:uncharacterized protein EI90DRAFT_3116489 [Cantharellus anzutake]|uniref:uncharacterized protein n=1 Tax=Cantharellus anzutake TaxID=1750568 RepID=UPI0019080004|nr:uncharacterized protein EI90DRAFT_3116489 [Cantharellus anzutake]KAF8341357.1 hypothetical protein EI90DRAFT_3116489 [Cantharellus anzutake]